MPRLLGICFIMAAMIFGFAACDKPEPVEPDDPEQELCEECGKNPCECETDEPSDSTEYTIKFSAKAEYEVPAEASSKTIIFTCDGPWTVVIPEDAQSWITAEPTSGEASEKRQSMKLNFAENTGAASKIHSGAGTKIFPL